MAVIEFRSKEETPTFREKPFNALKKHQQDLQQAEDQRQEPLPPPLPVKRHGQAAPPALREVQGAEGNILGRPVPCGSPRPHGGVQEGERRREELGRLDKRG